MACEGSDPGMVIFQLSSWPSLLTLASNGTDVTLLPSWDTATSSRPMPLLPLVRSSVPASPWPPDGWMLVTDLVRVVAPVGSLLSLMPSAASDLTLAPATCSHLVLSTPGIGRPPSL